MLPRVCLLVDEQVRQGPSQFLCAIVLIFNRLSLLSVLLRGRLVGQCKCGWHRLNGHHLHEDLLRVLQSLVERLVSDLQVQIILSAQGHRLHFLL